MLARIAAFIQGEEITASGRGDHDVGMRELPEDTGF
jgi:hypothetical protein